MVSNSEKRNEIIVRGKKERKININFFLFILFQCLIDYKWAEDDCAKNPITCPDGLTVSIWEKNTFPVMVRL